MSEHFHPFVVPFAVGFYLMGAILIVRFFIWIKGLPKQENGVVIKNIFSKKMLAACGEIFRESLIHLKIYRTHPMLGFMHMSLAFGWFLLIVGGKLETWYYTGNFANPIWYGLFFRFFEPVTNDFFMNVWMITFMDFSLLLILIGVGLAWTKRVKKRVVGMKNTTKHSRVNKIALFFLWMIFPLRLLAESATSVLHGGGGFLTSSVGKLISIIGVNSGLELSLWWAYSISLGMFFLFLPFSRYLHIPAEMVLIFLRHLNVKDEKGWHPNKGVQAFEVHSCSSCGICLDVCPAVNEADARFQATYFVKQVRAGVDYEPLTDSCYSCGSCNLACPVGVDVEKLRLGAREVMHQKAEFDHGYLPKPLSLWRESTEVVLFTGCMGRINPKATNAFKTLLEEAQTPFIHVDEFQSVCCGRPMMLAGLEEKVKQMIAYNEELIKGCNGKILVTTCPICYKVFKEKYQLKIPVMHHSEYLWWMMKEGKLEIEKSDLKYSYHDPCDLGRGSGIYEAPRNILKTTGNLLTLAKEREKALCCGNNLGSFSLPEETKQSVTKKTLEVLSAGEPDCIVTSCPMCKQTLQRQSAISVYDIAEVMVKQSAATQKEKARKHEHVVFVQSLS